MIAPILGRLRGKRNLARAPMPGALSGSFDINGDKLTGIVGKTSGMVHGDVWAEARRGQDVLARCAMKKGGGAWQEFEMPIEGRFTREELAREIVTVRACNSQGDSADLLMNGTTRLELIREFMGIAVETILDLDFRRSGNSRASLAQGWSAAEPDYTWTVGEESHIRFKSPPPPGPFLLRMKYSCFISDFVPVQPLDCFLNGHLVASFSEDHRRVTFREFRMSATVFEGVEDSVLKLVHPRAARPDKFGNSHDNRSLAFCFRTIAIVRVLNPDD